MSPYNNHAFSPLACRISKLYKILELYHTYRVSIYEVLKKSQCLFFCHAHAYFFSPDEGLCCVISFKCLMHVSAVGEIFIYFYSMSFCGPFLLCLFCNIQFKLFATIQNYSGLTEYHFVMFQNKIIEGSFSVEF